MKYQTGFTLIELMVTVVIVAILASIALPSYQEYVRRQRLATAKQEMMVIAGELERFKTKNFSYREFDGAGVLHSSFNGATGTLEVPVNEPTKHYTITLVDADSGKPLKNTDPSNPNSRGYGWKMVATANDNRNFNVMLTSTGLRCQTKDPLDTSKADCGTNGETW